MKKKITSIIVAILFSLGSLTFVGCGGEEGHNHESHEIDAEDHVHYQCPMDCEEGKTYEEPGSCPVCGMDLAEMKQ